MALASIKAAFKGTRDELEKFFDPSGSERVRACEPYVYINGEGERYVAIPVQQYEELIGRSAHVFEQQRRIDSVPEIPDTRETGLAAQLVLMRLEEEISLEDIPL